MLTADIECVLGSRLFDTKAQLEDVEAT